MTGVQGEIEAMEKALKQNAADFGQTLTIVKTDTVVMEYMPLPTVTTALRFLYRFLEPLPTVWTEGNVTLASSIMRGMEATMQNFALAAHAKLFLENSDRNNFPKQLEWVLHLKKATVYPCEIVRAPSTGARVLN
jgi:hypothetical protein